MKVALLAGHVGSDSLNPPGNHGGGEAATFAILRQLMDKYAVTLVVSNGTYPDLDGAIDYGYDVGNARWRNYGPSLDWVSTHDAMIAINHHRLFPPMCRLNILYSFFPQYQHWDVSGYQYILTDSQFSQKWIKHYWGVESEVVYPPINLASLNPQIFAVSGDNAKKANIYQKKNIIACVGRFFYVPGGNNKRHDIIINAFKELYLPDWELHLVGAVLDKNYYGKIRELAGNDNRIKFRHDLDRADYVQLLRDSSFVWSATGYEADTPSSKEHFGIYVLEAEATGAVPVVHKSGGPLETGFLFWEKPEELIELTESLIKDKTLYKAQQQHALKLAAAYARSETSIIDYLEKPDVFPPAEGRRKIYVRDTKPENVKVGLISDSPRRTFGFSVPARMIATGLKGMGYNVVSFGLQDPWKGKPDNVDYGEIYKYLSGISPEMGVVGMEHLKRAVEQANRDHMRVWRGWDTDPNGWQAMARFIQEEKLDILYIQYDLGNIRTILDIIRSNNINIPLVVHAPIEGSPITDSFIETLRLIRIMNGEPLFYTKWAHDEVIKAGGPNCRWVHLGGDHAKFAPLKVEDRQRWRTGIGWENRFVLCFGGRNKRTKGHPTLFQVMQILIKERPEVLLYCHSNPSDHIPNSSYALKELRSLYGLNDYVIFPPDLDDQGAGVDYEVAPQIEVQETSDINQIYHNNLKALSLIERLGCADLYVNLSEAEGFNLWLVEAMGCGLPVISVNDHGVQAEVLGEAASYIEPVYWDSWHTGARLPKVKPEDVAQRIIEVMDNEELRLGLAGASLERYKEFQWSAVVKTIDEIIKDRMGV